MISQLSPDEIRLRDEFAKAIMVAIVAEAGSDCHEDIAAKRAYAISDAMLKARVLPVPADLDVSEVVKWQPENVRTGPSEIVKP